MSGPFVTSRMDTRMRPAEFGVGARKRLMEGAAVPEAAVDEGHNSRPTEDEVGAAGDARLWTDILAVPEA